MNQYVSSKTEAAPPQKSNSNGGTSRPATLAIDRLDAVGAAASLACAVHCALLPLVITLLPLMGLAFLADDRVEWALLALSALLGIGSLCLGYRRHRSRRALAILSVGLALLVSGRIIESHEQPGALGVSLVVLGGITVAASHLLNRRLCRSCVTCHDHG